MKAVLMSDMMVIKSQAKSVLLVLVVWLGITIFNKSGLFFSALSTVYAMMLPLTCIAAYEKSHFARYLFTAPVSRASAAMGHYVFSIICAFCLSTIGFIASVALGMSVQEAVFSCSACFCIGIVMVSVILPVIYKYGTEKARLTMMAVFVVFLLGFGLLLNALDINMDSLGDALLLLPLLTVAVFAVSAAISVGIYKRREF